MSQVRARARTTLQVRAEIRASELGVVALAKRYNISRATAAKWKLREDTQDRSHRPHKLSTTLSEGQEIIVTEFRRVTLLPLDDLLVAVREFINPAVSRSALDRCLRRHGVGSLRDLKAAAWQADGEAAKLVRCSKDYVPGTVQVCIKPLPPSPDEHFGRFLFVAIDRATRWLFIRVYTDHSDSSRGEFLDRLHEAAPMQISKVLSENCSLCSAPITSKMLEPSDKHQVEVRRPTHDIEHLLHPSRQPQVNSLGEGVKGEMSDLGMHPRFTSAAELEAILTAYCKTYNHHIPQRSLKHLTPIQALKDWSNKRPDLFFKRVKDRSNPDS